MHKRTLLSCICVLLLFSSLAIAKDKNKDNKGNNSNDQLVIAQLSDTHLGLARAPEAAQNMQQAVDMINQRHPDAVLVTGDIGERESAWQQAKSILAKLDCKNVFIIPGNHDDKADNVDKWRSFWGPDYQVFHVKWATIIGIDSQLLGNYDNYNSKQVIPLSQNGQAEANKMLGWLANQKSGKDEVIFAMQHVPNSRAGGFPNDPKPYWTTQDPYRSREIDILHQLGVKDMFVGHWHIGMNYSADGIHYHVAPATSWSPFSDKLGFAMHTIKRNGDVKTEFVYLSGADAHKP